MDETAFDTLTRRVAGNPTRRAVLGALVGGALLLGETATVPAKRRKKAESSASSRRPISVQVYNWGKTPLTVNHGEHGVTGLTTRCWDRTTVSIAPNTDMVFRSVHPKAYLIFNTISTLQFENALFVRPDVTVVQNGVYYNKGHSCPPWGTLLWKDAKMDIGTTRDIMINGQLFRVNRTRDTNYKEFRVWVGLVL